MRIWKIKYPARDRGTGLALLDIRGHDLERRRRGRILAVILLGTAFITAALSVYNAAQGQHEYAISNAVSLLILLALYLINRRGFVRTASTITVVLMSVLPFVLFDEPTLQIAYGALTFPIFVASFLIAPWSGFVVAGGLIWATVLLGIASEAFYFPLIVFAILSVIVYVFAESLNRAYRQSRHQALHDSLTGLPNRESFMSYLEHALASAKQTSVAVLFLDLDNFKVINDSLGHEVGDQLLVAVAGRLRACLRSGDTAARFGGDEFTILIKTDGASAATRISERIVEELRAPFFLRGREIYVTTSIGIVLSTPEHTPEGLLRDADIALYRAKNVGKGSYEVFDLGMSVQAEERLELETDLRRAVERGELRLHYQPEVLLESGRVAGMEALVRWEHPSKGLVSPDRFIPIAEETGLILPIGRWVLREACRQARLWKVEHRDLMMSVNLSSRQLQHPGLVRDVAQILRETGLEARNLTLEITESTLMEDIDSSIMRLQHLKALGVSLSLDDFGTGYSSLSYLKRFPVNFLKIDKSFVDELEHEPADAAIVQAVITLAKSLGMRVVAEGVETADQLTRLLEMGCDWGQGHYFAKPLTNEAARHLLAGLVNDLGCGSREQ